ncbi:MAG TPA: hypothetical protein VFW25_10675 [Silvibacterium sp.]|nr:hypothetical protein [Silvibacterium sp.]
MLDTTEIGELVNLTEDTHPIHLHLVRFNCWIGGNPTFFIFRIKATFAT